MLINLSKFNLPKPIVQVLKKQFKNTSWKLENTLINNQITSCILKTDQGLLSIRYSQDKEKIDNESIILKLCQRNSIPVAKILLQQQVMVEDLPLYIIIEKISGVSFRTQPLNIFDHNRVLTELAKILLKLHSIEVGYFGFLYGETEDKKQDWNDLFVMDIDKELEFLSKTKIISKNLVKNLHKILHTPYPYNHSHLLHGQLSSSGIYIDNNLRISALTDFIQPLGGDPAYDLAGFLVYDGLERAERLTKSYYLLGGQVEWDSSQFLKNALRRSLRALNWAGQTKSKNITARRNLLYQLVSRYKSS